MANASSPPLGKVRFTGGLLAERIALVHGVMIPYQWEALNDRVEGAERSGAVQNVRIAAGEIAGKFHGHCFQDSDLHKWIEAASHRLATAPDPALDAALDGIIATLARAQLPDGYLNTYVQVSAPDQRFANLRDNHELYCAGHLIEAGVAHFAATGKRSLLDVCRRLADMVDRTFGPGPGQIRGYPGHEELELALVKLAGAAGEPRYARLAAWFVLQRGAQPPYFEEEARRRKEDKLPYFVHVDGLSYWQAHRPVVEQTEPVGHAVRAMYLYTAMADVARETGDAALARACRTLWDSLVRRHLYITGGVGADPWGEKFSEGLDLPNDRAYAETCASVGLVFFARRMLDLELRGEFGDVMERALYNNVLAGMALDGRKFFYVNPLEVRPAVARRRYDCHSVKVTRVGWFGCACCPPNIARLLASAGAYAYATMPDGLAIHLYAEGGIDFTAAGGTAVRVDVRTQYPWDGEIALAIGPADPATFALRLRIPGWCRGAAAAVNGRAVTDAARDGYLEIRREWRKGDTVSLSLPMPVERVRADPRVSADAGCVALQRGPLVYCLEEADNGADLAALSLPRSAGLRVRRDPALLGGCAVVEGDGARELAGDSLYTMDPPRASPAPIRAIPYALWANRGEGEMRVWIRET